MNGTMDHEQLRLMEDGTIHDSESSLIIDSNEDGVNEGINDKDVTLSEGENETLETLNTENKNTLRKTDTDIRIFMTYLRTQEERRLPEIISPIELDKHLSNFFAGIKKHDGNEYEPASLRGMLCSIERYLKIKHYPASVTRDFIFSNTRHALKTKQQQLRELGKGIKKPLESMGTLTFDRVKDLFSSKEMGPHSPTSVINTLCLTIMVHFRLRKAIDHKNLLWGDIKLRTDSAGREYLLYEPLSTLRLKASKRESMKTPIYFLQSTLENAERDPIKIYKFYAEKRPSNMNYDNAPFYLGITTMYPAPMQAWYRTCAMGVNKLSDLVRMMREITGLPKPVSPNQPLLRDTDKGHLSITAVMGDKEHRKFSLPEEKDYIQKSQSMEPLKKFYEDISKDSDQDVESEEYSSSKDASFESDADLNEDHTSLRDKDIEADEGQKTETSSSLATAKTYFVQMIQRLDTDSVHKFKEWLGQVDISVDPIRGRGICRERQVCQDDFARSSGSSRKSGLKADDFSAAKITLNITLAPRSILGKGPITVTASTNKDFKSKEELAVCPKEPNYKSNATENSCQTRPDTGAKPSKHVLSSVEKSSSGAKRRRYVDLPPASHVHRANSGFDSAFSSDHFTTNGQSQTSMANQSHCLPSVPPAAHSGVTSPLLHPTFSLTHPYSFVGNFKSSTKGYMASNFLMDSGRLSSNASPSRRYTPSFTSSAQSTEQTPTKSPPTVP